MARVEILGIKVDAATKTEVKAKLSSWLEKKEVKLITTPNSEIVVLAQRDRELKEILNSRSALNLADGMGLLWAARFMALHLPQTPILRQILTLVSAFLTLILFPLRPKFFRHPIPERISGADFIWTLSRLAAEQKQRLFLLGGAPTVAERCALKLQTDIPNLRVSGVNSGSSQEIRSIIETVRKSKADILMVAFGAPKQEKWLAQNLAKTGCRIGIGLGGTFDFVAGVRKRAPGFIQHLGIEWLYRLFLEPWRWQRQIALPKFIWLVVLEKMKGRL